MVRQGLNSSRAGLRQLELAWQRCGGLLGATSSSWWVRAWAVISTVIHQQVG